MWDDPKLDLSLKLVCDETQETSLQIWQPKNGSVLCNLGAKKSGRPKIDNCTLLPTFLCNTLETCKLMETHDLCHFKRKHFNVLTIHSTFQACASALLVAQFCSMTVFKFVYRERERLF